MTSRLIEYLEKKHLLILGFGMEGQSTYHYIRKHLPGKPLVIADRDPNLENRIMFLHNDTNLSLISGEAYIRSLDSFDVVIKSPGVLLDSNGRKATITSQTDMVMQLFRKQVIGITGTKGKSTTSSLLYHILQRAGKEVVLVGNIGIPPFDLIDHWNDQTTVIYELSSHQLQEVTLSPHISILLNLYQEHLDHYPSFEAYQSTKLAIIRYQQADDFAVINGDDERIACHVKTIRLPSRQYGFSAKSKSQQGCSLLPEGIIRFSDNGESSDFFTDKTSLKGEHNRMNMMAAVCASKIINIPDHHIQAGLDTFQGLAHRMEYLGLFHGIHYYNDSIATVPEATMHAIEALHNVDTLILGGFDRGIDYQELVRFLMDSSVTNLIFIGEAGERIKRMFPVQASEAKRLLSAKDLTEVVQLAMALTRKNTICLLSPSAASYGMFKDFKERGDSFRELVKNS